MDTGKQSPPPSERSGQESLCARRYDRKFCFSPAIRAFENPATSLPATPSGRRASTGPPAPAESPAGLRYQDTVKRRLLRPAQIAVPSLHRHIRKPQTLQTAFRIQSQAGYNLNRVNLPRQAGKDGGLVAGAGPNLQNRVGGLHPQQFRHQGDDVRLRDGLVLSDRKGI